MNFREIIKSIENENYQPIYFLNGENTYFIDKISDKLLNSVLEGSERDFNETIFYGKDSNPEMILDVCKRYPVMSSYQLVVVREAQHLSKTLSYFENYFKKPVPSTILVFCFKGKKIDKRKSVGKLLSKLNYIYDSDQLKNINYQIGLLVVPMKIILSLIAKQ